MRGVLVRALGLIAWLTVPCFAGCAPEARTVQLSLRPAQSIACRPTELTSIEVRPLGDFPTSERPVVRIDPFGGPQSVERFPSGTEALTVRAEGIVRLGAGVEPWEGGGIAIVGATSSSVALPLLRFGRGCVLSDLSARIPSGAVALPLEDGRLFIGGGFDGGALATVITVRPGESLVEFSSPRLFVPRVGAAGVLLPGDQVFISGGAGGEDAPALDTFEILAMSGTGERSVGQGFMLRARQDHAAFAHGGDVILVGGRDGQLALDDAERVSLGGAFQVVRLTPVTPRWSAHPLVLDDGVVLVVGGRSADGPSPAIERYEGDDRFIRLADLAPREFAAWTPLPGGRALRLGGQADGAWTSDFALLLDGGETVISGETPFPPLVGPVATATQDGRVLVVGGDVESGNARGWLFDPADGRELESIATSRLARHLLRLSDGTFVEGDAEGLSLLRLNLAHPFDDPQATLFPAQTDQRSQLTLDGPDRWEVRGQELIAVVEGARLDLPTSRFRELRIQAELTGTGRLLFDVPGRVPHFVEIGAETLRYEGCVAPRVSPITVERRAGRLWLGEVSCAFPESARVSVGFSMAEGSGVVRLAVSRISP